MKGRVKDLKDEELYDILLFDDDEGLLSGDELFCMEGGLKNNIKNIFFYKNKVLMLLRKNGGENF